MNVKVAVASLNQTPFDWFNNENNILEVIYNTERDFVSVLCLPELCITGYGCEDAFFFNNLTSTAWEMMTRLAKKSTDRFSFNVGLPVEFNGSLYNCTAYLANGRVQGIVPKKYLAQDGIHYENRWFQEWEEGKVSKIKNIPFGDLVFDCGSLKLGFEICEEAWVPNRTASSLCRRGVDLILNPSASHFSFGKYETRRQFVRDGSRAFECAYLYSNLLGNEAGRVIYDGDCLIASGGEIVARTKRFSFRDYQLATAIIDLNGIRVNRKQRNGFKVDDDFLNETSVKTKCKFVIDSYSLRCEAKPIVSENMSKELEFLGATTLGLFDYLRKTKSKGYVVSLSGGIDSSVVAYLAYQMKIVALSDLGMNTQKKLGLTNEEFNSILRCYYLATDNNSNETSVAAKELCDAMKVNFQNINIDPTVNNYQGLIENELGEELTWEKYDVAKQNIQARTRAPLVWMFANIYNSILLTTSNRSEAAVGYATMDGDTCGGLNPIGGVDKEFLINWLRWAEGHSTGEVSRALKLINNNKPSAELRPLEQKQTDEDDLMPYGLLNEIEKLSIGKKMSPNEVYKRISKNKKYFNFEDDYLKRCIEKFFKLWSINQWKRERYAPSFHLDDRSLDPKTWCRFPILSGGFSFEKEK